MVSVLVASQGLPRKQASSLELHTKYMSHRKSRDIGSVYKGTGEKAKAQHTVSMRQQ